MKYKKKNVNGMIKLGSEITNTRVEFLKKFKFKDCHDIDEMHWKARLKISE